MIGKEVGGKNAKKNRPPPSQIVFQEAIMETGEILFFFFFGSIRLHKFSPPPWRTVDFT